MLLAVLVFRSFNGSSEPGTPSHHNSIPSKPLRPHLRNPIIARFRRPQSGVYGRASVPARSAWVTFSSGPIYKMCGRMPISKFSDSLSTEV
jgi:hypothetical protein